MSTHACKSRWWKGGLGILGCLVGCVVDAQSEPDVAALTQQAMSGESVTTLGGPVIFDPGVPWDGFFRPRWTYEQTLHKGNMQPYGEFGGSVAMSEDLAVVGSPNEGDGGAAYVFKRLGLTWSLVTRLASPATTTYGFGSAVALSGDTIAVGAPYADSLAGSATGVVYLYQRDAVTGAFTSETLYAPGSAAWDAFGDALALDGNRLVVGAPHKDRAGLSNTGAAYVFARGATGWGSPLALAAPTPRASDNFGTSVASAGNHVFVGAPGRDETARADVGAVYAYRQDLGFGLQERLPVISSYPGDRIGTTLAAESVTASLVQVLVGAPGADFPASGAGAAYLFRGGSSFAQHANLWGPGGSAFAGFGRSVALSGGNLLVGAPYHTGGDATSYSGAVYASEESVEGYWEIPYMVGAEHRRTDGLLGHALAVAGPYALVAAPNDDGSYTGAVHTMHQTGAGWQHGHTLRAAGQDRQLTHQHALAQTADTLAVAGETGIDVYVRDPAGWSLAQELKAEPVRAYSAVALDGDRLAFLACRAASGGEQPFVHLYQRNAEGTFSYETSIEPPLPAYASREAACQGNLTLQGDTLAVGFPWFAASTGRVLVYRRGVWGWGAPQCFATSAPADMPCTVSATPGPTSERYFGFTVALDGDTLVISERDDNHSGLLWPGVRQGRVHVYTRTGAGAFAPAQPPIMAPVVADRDHFGAAVALEGNLLAISGQECAAGTTCVAFRIYERDSVADAFEEVYAAPGNHAVSLSIDRAQVAAGIQPHSFVDPDEVRVYGRGVGGFVLQRSLRSPDAANPRMGTAVSLVGSRLVTSSGYTSGSLPVVHSFVYRFPW